MALSNLSSGSGIISTSPEPSMDQAEEQECSNRHSQEEEDGQRDWKHTDSTILLLHGSVMA